VKRALVTLGILAGAAIGVFSWAPLYALVGPWGCVAIGVGGLLSLYAAVNYAFYGRALPPEER
jgi:hypothetical protein